MVQGFGFGSGSRMERVSKGLAGWLALILGGGWQVGRAEIISRRRRRCDDNPALMAWIPAGGWETSGSGSGRTWTPLACSQHACATGESSTGQCLSSKTTSSDFSVALMAWHGMAWHDLLNCRRSSRQPAPATSTSTTTSHPTKRLKHADDENSRTISRVVAGISPLQPLSSRSECSPPPQKKKDRVHFCSGPSGTPTATGTSWRPPCRVPGVPAAGHHHCWPVSAAIGSNKPHVCDCGLLLFALCS
ncbi:uncharacterized protein IWZ02DRAFT_316641 [Phyllosticta citriasiana]|uniref:uncharacterized protein n=1 Tax=Phyllosticta citriasiana TaxID=595635 RepID=UPI0030FD78EE